MVVPFSDPDQAAIRQAVSEAERHTRGEIVPIVIEQSARYREARYRAGIGCAFFTLSLLLTLAWEWPPWVWRVPMPGWILLAVTASYAIGYGLGTFKPVIRLLTSTERMAFKVNLRAHQAFLEHGLHRTELGTGVLILISLLEHRIEVLTDRPILDRVPPETWSNMVRVLQEGFQAGRPVDSLCQAITACGIVLADAFPATAGESNPNEFPNDLIQEP